MPDYIIIGFVICFIYLLYKACARWVNKNIYYDNRDEKGICRNCRFKRKECDRCLFLK